MVLRILSVFAVLCVASIAVAVVLLMAAQGVGFRSPLFAFIAASALLGVVIMTSRVVPWRVPDALRSVRDWERTGKMPRLMGVPLFGALVRRRPLRYLNGALYLGRRPGDLAAVHAGLLYAESAHFWALLLSVPLLVYAVARGWWDAVAWQTATNAVFHLYPVLNLRRVRARLEPLLGCRLSGKSLPAPAVARGS